MNYVITGAGFHNRGAESMLYSLITAIQERECDESDFTISILCAQPNEAKTPLLKKNIKIIKDSNSLRKKALRPFALFSAHLRKNKALLDFIRAFKDCDVVLDISGYSLSSQWGEFSSYKTLSTIRLAKKFKKKILLLPQSFGPFDYPENTKILLKDIKKWLSEADLIFVREQAGYERLEKLGLHNTVLSTDIVLQGPELQRPIYRENLPSRDIAIEPNSVLIIPSKRVFERMNREFFLQLYFQIITQLLNHHLNVYLAYYDITDMAVCQDIMNLFPHTSQVRYISSDLDCMEYTKILPKFKFLITSRFHSAVHAYRHNIPCLIIGWAEKYQELTKQVGQEQFLFDCRQSFSATALLAKITQLFNHLARESETIKNKMVKIQKNNCYEQMWQCIDPQ